MYQTIPYNSFNRLFERVGTFIDNPHLLRRFSEKKADKDQAIQYCNDVGLTDLLVPGQQSEIEPQFVDLAIIHRHVATTKPKVVVEFGVGFSTLTIAHALHLNGNGKLHTVDASERWLDNTEKKIPSHLRSVADLRHAKASAHMINGQLCTLYDDLPNVEPNFIYLDAPHGSDVDGQVNGLSFNLENRPRQPVAADPLLYESSAPGDFFILVDGRARNVDFLRKNLQGRYRFHQSLALKQSYFQRID